MKGVTISWFTTLFVFVVFALGLLLFFGANAFRKEHRRGYDVLTDFPFEMTCGEGNSYRMAKIISFVFAGFDALSAAYLIILESIHPQLLSFSILYLVLVIGKDVAFCFMANIPAYNFRPHILSFTFYSALTVLSLTVSALLFFNGLAASFGVALTFMILLGVLALGGLAFLFNPKLSQWTRLDAVAEQDGSITTSRPRPFPLAATEWLFVLLSSLGTILTLIGFFVLSLTQL